MWSGAGGDDCSGVDVQGQQDERWDPGTGRADARLEVGHRQGLAAMVSVETQPGDWVAVLEACLVVAGVLGLGDQQSGGVVRHPPTHHLVKQPAADAPAARAWGECKVDEKGDAARGRWPGSHRPGDQAPVPADPNSAQLARGALGNQFGAVDELSGRERGGQDRCVQFTEIVRVGEVDNREVGRDVCHGSIIASALGARLWSTVAIMTLAVCPGSFDPITLGHLDIIGRAAVLFDEVVVGVARNSAKSTLLSIDERVALAQAACAHWPGVRIEVVPGLLVDFCRELGADAVVKGLRGGADFDGELPMALMNRHLSGIETVFLPGDPALGHIASSLVKDVARHGGPISDLVPDGVDAAVRAALDGIRPSAGVSGRPEGAS